MRYYVDSSALMKLWLDEQHAEGVRCALDEATERASSLLARVECHGALSRLAHEGRLSPAHLTVVESEAEYHLRSTDLIGIDELLLKDAETLAKRYHLKSLDAIHLATALAVKLLSDQEDWVFMTFDLKLGHAAHAEGLDVWPPTAQP